MAEARSDGLQVHTGQARFKGKAGSLVTVKDGILTASSGLAVTAGSVALPAGSVAGASLATGAALANLAANSITKIWGTTSAPTGTITSATYAAAPAPFNSFALTGYTGGPLVFLATIHIYPAVNNQGFSLALSINGANALNWTGGSLPISNVQMGPVSLIYVSPGGAFTTFGLLWCSNGSNVLTWSTGFYSHFYAIELKK